MFREDGSRDLSYLKVPDYYIYEFRTDKFPPHIDQYIPKGIYSLEQRNMILDKYLDCLWEVRPGGLVTPKITRVDGALLTPEYKLWLLLQVQPWTGMVLTHG